MSVSLKDFFKGNLFLTYRK